MGEGAEATLTPPPQKPPSTSEPIEIAARHRARPYVQGQLDGLCGLLSTINALRLAWAAYEPLTDRECRGLFAAGVDYLQRKNGFHTAAVIGMDLRRRLALTRYLAKLASSDACQAVIERPQFAAWSSIDDVYAWIDDSMRAGKPVLITLAGGLDHYSVVAGMTASSLLLFDSQYRPQRLIRRSSCGLRGDSYYRIPPNGLLRVALKRSG